MQFRDLKGLAKEALPKSTWEALLFAVVLACGTALTLAMGHYGERLEQNHLRALAATAAASLEGDTVAALQASPSDSASAGFEHIRAALARMRQALPGVRFVYLIAKRGAEWRFLADAEPPSSKDYSPPGEVYQDDASGFETVLETGKPFVEGPSRDEWGIWVSGEAPVRGPPSGRVVAVLGIDVDASRWVSEVANYRWIGFAIATLIFIIAGLFSAGLRRQDRHLRILRDAQRIIDNSSTVLYRLEASPSLPLTHISSNLANFGHDPAGLVAGGVLYRSLVHPEDQALVRTAYGAVLDGKSQGGTVEYRLRTGDGKYLWVENRYHPVFDAAGKLREIEGVFHDITERKEATATALQHARSDSLTGLANRAVFFERLEEAIKARKRGAPAFAVLYVDLDRFKEVNDTQGHAFGDELLKAIADRIRSNTRAADLVARLGGDEFAVLQTNVGAPADAGHLAEKLIQAVGQVHHLEGSDVLATCSVGVATNVDGGFSGQDLVTQADEAMYRAKAEGRNKYCFFEEGLDVTVKDRIALASELASAVETGQLDLYYQPQVDMTSGRIVGMEALMRWNHPTRGLLLPAAFLDRVTKPSLADRLCRWTIEKACGQQTEWRKAGLVRVPVAINLSAASFASIVEVERVVRREMGRLDLPPQGLELEISESALAAGDERTRAVLERFQSLGIGIAVDRFGAGQSSLARLSELKLSRLKIDREHVRGLPDRPQDVVLVRSAVSLARELGTETMAVGVATPAQADFLVACGCRFGQGFLYGEAVTAAKATELLRAGSLSARKKDESSPSRALKFGTDSDT